MSEIGARFFLYAVNLRAFWGALKLASRLELRLLLDVAVCAVRRLQQNKARKRMSASAGV